MVETTDKIWTYFRSRVSTGQSTFVLKGGRRSGKTWHGLEFMGLRALKNPNYVGSVAAMTNDQGRLGSYADMKRIIGLNPFLFRSADVVSHPLEIRFPKSSKIIFKSYSDSETAKGIACNDLFINEANKFTKQQYLDLKANATDYTIIDYNPNVRFWVDEIFDPSEICTTTFRDNPYLSKAQLEYFDTLKRLAERPEATSVDKRNFLVYYLGEFAEITGQIFTRENIRMQEEFPKREDGSLALRNFKIFCDPSALRGADYFACCVSAVDDWGNVWIVATFSVNTGTREAVTRRLMDWCRLWDIDKVYIETNGIVGLDYYDFASNSGLPVESWYSHGNKYQRIVDNYQNLTTQLVVYDTPENREYLEQVYDFSEKCEHDDNIDAVNSSYNMQRWTA